MSESETNNNDDSSGKCSQKECANQKRKLLQIILADLKLLSSKVRDDPQSRSYIKEVCDGILLALSEEMLLNRFYKDSYNPEHGKWYIDKQVQLLKAEKKYYQELSVKVIRYGYCYSLKIFKKWDNLAA